MPQKCIPERQKGLKPQSIKTVGKVTGSLSQVTTELTEDQNRGQIHQHKLGFGIKNKENHYWHLQRKHSHESVWKTWELKGLCSWSCCTCISGSFFSELLGDIWYLRIVLRLSLLVPFKSSTTLSALKPNMSNIYVCYLISRKIQSSLK